MSISNGMASAINLLHVVCICIGAYFLSYAIYPTAESPTRFCFATGLTFIIAFSIDSCIFKLRCSKNAK